MTGNSKRSSEMKEKRGEKMPAVWFALKRSLHCKSEPSEVHDPNVMGSRQLGTILTKKKAAARSGCSRSISNLKDVVIHGSKRHLERPSCSPRSIGSSEFLNPIAHEVVLSDSTCELKITGYGDSAAFLGTLRPGTPGPGGSGHLGSVTPPRRSPRPLTNSFSDTLLVGNGGGGIRTASRPSAAAAPVRFSMDNDGSIANIPAAIVCHKCGEQLAKWEAAEAHHLLKHAVTELVEGDSSRKIVEIICKASWLKSSESNCWRIERVLKVHNMQKTLARFEEYREMVKAKASKLPKKHPRCLADGNELLRFHGTTISCNLGGGGGGSSSSLCSSDKCNVCRIIRHGFSMTAAKGDQQLVGVFTTSTSARAYESIKETVAAASAGDHSSARKALLVCRVIAGRVHKPLDNYQELMAGQSGFDSLAGKVGLYANIEELFLLNPRALLPCFVVICKS